MSSLAIASVMFSCVLGSFLAAIRIARRLPKHHLSAESRDAIKLGLGVISTLTALVLGLLVAAAKETTDAQNATVKELAVQCASVDRVLARYGPETREARAELREFTEAVLHQVWPQEGATHIEFSGGESKNQAEAFLGTLAALEPGTDSQRMLKSRAQEISLELSQLRQRLVVNNQRSIPLPLLMVLCFWQAALFAGFALLVPRNATTMTVLLICMLSVSGCIFLVLELDRPFAGLIRVSDAPLRSVMSHMGE